MSLSFAIPQDWVSVAKIGRSIGIKGDVLLHLLSDFPESLKAGNIYHTQKGDLILESYSLIKSTARFYTINSKEAAKSITNLVLYSTQEETKAQCILEDNVFFWFEMIGALVVENGEILGTVQEIERFCNTDYLSVKTDSILLKQGFSKHFLIPYTRHYVLETKLDSILMTKKLDSKVHKMVIYTQSCKDILESS